ncbi:MAG: chemotaxis protein CheW [Nitrospirae bacterium]|nr:MAG: chemotaxis protein CheW [Nitrospirota bacterium]
MESPEEIRETEIAPEGYVAPEINACVFRAGGVTFSVPVEELIEIVEVSEIIPLPGSPDYLLGIAHYRGKAVPVIDLGFLEGEHAVKKPEWLVVIQTGDEVMGIAVEEMPDLRRDFEGKDISASEIYTKYRIT